MNISNITKVLLLLSLVMLVSACNKLTINWPEYDGYISEEPYSVSVKEQNILAMERLSKQGFEVAQIERGIIIYLPPNIYFAENKSDINNDARQKISLIASEANKDYLQQRHIEVLGHSSALGTSRSNMSLSKKRAEAATAELIFSKIAKDRISETWFGESNPRFIEEGKKGKAAQDAANKNQRVEFIILNSRSR